MLILLALACSEPAPEDTAWERGDNPHALDDVLRLNHVQVKGTHNSYHLEPADPIDDSHRYSHPTLTEQLAQYDVRQLELDLHLAESGEWEIFHLPGVDAESTCSRFADCLAEIKAWSDDNGWHLPVVIWLEPKDDIDGLADGYELIEERIVEVDAAIAEVFPPARVFTPDDLRGEHADLPARLAAEGWPTLGEVRGQVIFALLDTGSHRERYLAGAPGLEGRTLFVDSGSETEPFAAMVKDGSSTEITAWAEAGFLITDNGSGASDEASAAQAEDEADLAAGVHHLATDLAAPGGDYWLDLAPRCNPVTAPAECVDAEVERLE